MRSSLIEQIGITSDENRAKSRAAHEHFDLINREQRQREYHFHFLTPEDYDLFFQFLRERKMNFVSALDRALSDDNVSSSATDG